MPTFIVFLIPQCAAVIILALPSLIPSVAVMKFAMMNIGVGFPVITYSRFFVKVMDAPSRLMSIIIQK
jgi:hypothetical protein